FSVVNGTDARVTMTVTLQDSSRNPLVNEQFQVRAYAENAAAIRVFDGWEWHYRTGDTLTETWTSGAPGTYFLYAQAYYGDAPWAEDGFDWGSWHWNNCGLAWGGISNVVELTFEGFGECERVYAQLAQTAVVRGEFLSFTIPEADHAEWYDVHVRNDHGNYYDARYPAPGTYAIPTARMEADDEYVVLISTSASGYQGSESFYEQAPRFIVYDPEDGQIRFRVSKTVVETSEDFVISVWAPGADAIRILEGTRQMDSRWNTDSYNEWHALLYAGTYELQAMVHYPDMAGERARWVSSDPVIMTAGNPNTPELDLNALAFNMPDAIGPGQDLTLSWQDIGLYHYDVNIYRERDGHRVWHSWNDHGETSLTVPRVMPDTLPNSVDWFEAPGTVLLEEGEIYHVQIHFNKIGYNAAELSRQFAVLETNSQTGISLTVGGSQTALSIPVNTSVTVQVHAPDGATAALVWGGYDWQWYELDEHGDAEFEWSWGDLNQRVLYARYTTEPVGSYGNWEDYSWNGPSNLVTVHPTSTGKTAAPDVTMASTVLTGTEVTFTVNNAASFNGFHWTIQDLADDWEWSWEDWHGESTQTFSTRGFVIGRTYYLKVDSHGTEGLLPNQTVIPFVVEGSGMLPEAQASVPASVTRGDVLEITILNGGTLSQAQGLTVQAAPYDALYDRWFGSWYDWDGEDTILIPTANLEARSEPYMLYVECTADGWETSHSEYAFTVTESAQANLHFARTSAETQENIVYTLYVPGATSTMITVDEQPGWTMDNTWIQGPWDRNYAEETIRFDQNGSHEVRLYGQYGTDEWVYTGQSVTVQVTGADLDLESLLPDTLLIGQNFQPDLPEGMTQVAINVYDDTMQGLEIYWMNWDEGRRSDYNYFDTDSMTWAVPNDGEPMHGNDGSVLIPAEYLKENHTYIIDMRLAVRGYNTVHLQYVSFVVISGTDSRVSFTVTYPDPTRNPLIQEHLEILAHAEGASVIRFYDGRGWYYNTGDTYQGSWSTTEPGTRTMFAQAYFGEVPWTEQNINPYTFDWDAYDLAWCGISNMVEVTVESLGQAGSFDFVDHSTVNAKQGEVVAIAFTEAANASTYYLQVYNQDNYIQWSTWSDEENVYLRTVNLPEGTYTLRGRVRGTVGYEMNDSTGTVTLIVQSAETLGTPTMRTPGALTEIEEEAFEGTAAEVVEIGFGVTDIGARAFADSQLEQIILPSSVGSIGAGALDSGVAVFGEFDSYAMYWALSNGFRFYEMQ
ncbi:MAG: leucine-rich repeat domain-containing protein, partial [Clostridiales bacterium]|nr:leucine-rich repeat domain-containing protein [Clostridiales bacterium]